MAVGDKKKSPLEDCDRPACDEILNMFNAAKERHLSSKKEAAKPATVVECPPKSSELGRASWTLLHTMAAWYPDEPNEKDREHMTKFMAALARFYPCPWCATDFQTNLQKKPVQTSSRKELCQWLCDQHNLVNKKLGKPLFDCNIKKLDERWRKSSQAECQSGH